MKYESFIIAGPTASGKSTFAHALAKRIHGTIINCDSVQIYKGIETISASPFADINTSNYLEIDSIPYKLFSILPLSEQISVSDYLGLATKAYNETLADKRVPIFVGGSGYYINVLINGISPIPEVREHNRLKARQLVDTNLNEAKKILPNDFILTDPQRIARALEVFFETGKHITEWQHINKIGAITPPPYKILINPDKEILTNRISSRINTMLSTNAVQEAQTIIKNNLNDKRAIGATQICSMIRQQISQQECIEKWITATNQYAKRQRTWYRIQYAADYVINHIPTETDLDLLLNQLQ